MTWIALKHNGRVVGQIEYVHGQFRQVNIHSVLFAGLLGREGYLDIDTEDPSFNNYLTEEQQKRVVEEFKGED